MTRKYQTISQKDKMNLTLFKKLWKSLQMDKTVGKDAPISFVEFLEVALRDMPEPPSLGVSDEEAQEVVDWWNSKPFTQKANAKEVVATVEQRVEAAKTTPQPSRQEFQSQVPAAVSGNGAYSANLAMLSGLLQPSHGPFDVQITLVESSGDSKCIPNDLILFHSHTVVRI